MIFAMDGLVYRHRYADRDTLAGVSLAIEGGRTTALLGHSGSGKTTLLRVLGLLWSPPRRRGVLKFNGPDGKTVDYASLRFRPGRRAGMRREVFGFVLQTPLLLPHLTCEENLALPLALRGVGRKAWTARVEGLLNEADPDGTMAALRERRAREVSGGERQRFAVLRAIIHDPEVLFADEPVSSLDPRNAERLLGVLHRWRQGELPGQETRARPRTLILVSHDTRSACKMADRALVLSRGKVIRDIPLGSGVDRHALAPELEAWICNHG
jgi:ABC-type lipoprotein export system ATPase subunit